MTRLPDKRLFADRAPPTPRRPGLDFDEEIPRHWFAGLALPTHIVNGVNLLFPAGERFFVRSVKRYLSHFENDPAALAQIRGFFGQEGRHAREHERFFAVMKRQGYDIDGFLDRYQKITFGVVERLMPGPLCLATTAACEHYTALLAELVFTDGAIKRAHPTMYQLLAWHAAEELEHKAVAFDVLQRLYPSYALRVAGLVTGTGLLATWWVMATWALLRQDQVTRRQARRERRMVQSWRERAHLLSRDIFARGIIEYLRPGFHPDDRDNRHLATEYLQLFEREAERMASA
ncbi:MAG: metal-dependent hydrolase [Haliangiales bacterium]